MTAVRVSHRKLFESLLLAILGTVMLVSKIAMEALPNIHTVGLLTAVYTLVYRRKALIPLYIYVLLNGLYAGFSVWWIPYLYLWTVLWGTVMLIPRRFPLRVQIAAAWVLCILHGLSFGLLYAPFWAAYAGLDWQGTLAWVAVGFPYDLLHGAGNAVLGLLIWPLTRLLQRLNRMYQA